MVSRRSKGVSADVQEASLNPTAAMDRFRRATNENGDEEKVAQQRSLYRQYLSVWGGYQNRDGEGLVETAEQRLQRLMHEAQELDEQLKSETTDEEGEHRILLTHVQRLRLDLEQMAEKRQKAMAGRHLLDRLQQKNELPLVVEQKIKEEDHGVFEARIAALEKIVGEGEVAEGVVGAVARMDAQLQLLAQPRALEAAVKRLRTLMGTVEKAAEAKVIGETSAKVDEIFEVVQQLDLVMQRGIVERLRALKELHLRAAAFSKSLSSLDAEQQRFDTQLSEIQERTHTLTARIEENQTSAQSSLEVLGDRIENLLTRIESLSS